LNDPLRVDWIPFAAVPRLRDALGALGMTFLPGKQGSGWMGNHRRNLQTDAVALSDIYRADVLLLLVEDHELASYQVVDIEQVMAAHGIEVIRHPIADMEIPDDRVGYAEVLRDLTMRIQEGSRVVVACRGGLGRTGTAVACMLVDAGLSPTEAIRLTRATRANTIERGGQEEFVNSWRASSHG
jgi:protein-tyrosine phosphatase